MNPTCLCTQVREFYYCKTNKRLFRKHGILRLAPFYLHVHWMESDIVSTIAREFGWESNPERNASWRGDCSIAMLKSYIYRRILGFNDTDDNLSCLIRDGQISREDALDRLRTEGDVSETAIERVLSHMSIGYREFQNAIERATAF